MKKDSKPKTTIYLTPDIVRKLTPGREYCLAHNDFTHGRFRWRFKRAEMKDGRLEAVGRHIDPDCSETWDHTFYESNGPHKDGSMTPIMCSGIGAERVFFTRMPAEKIL